MLHDGRAKRVAVVGGSRIPFCRAHSIYRDVPNQDMMTAALDGLVNKYDLKGQTMGDVVLGAVIKHSRDFNLARESALDSGFSPRTQPTARRLATAKRTADSKTPEKTVVSSFSF